MHDNARFPGARRSAASPLPLNHVRTLHSDLQLGTGARLPSAAKVPCGRMLIQPPQQLARSRRAVQAAISLFAFLAEIWRFILGE